MWPKIFHRSLTFLFTAISLPAICLCVVMFIERMYSPENTLFLISYMFLGLILSLPVALATLGFAILFETRPNSNSLFNKKLLIAFVALAIVAGLGVYLLGERDFFNSLGAYVIPYLFTVSSLCSLVAGLAVHWFCWFIYKLGKSLLHAKGRPKTFREQTMFGASTDIKAMPPLTPNRVKDANEAD
jgi:hypothetical protein